MAPRRGAMRLRAGLIQDGKKCGASKKFTPIALPG
jgi:hypothetical protein